HVAPVTGRVADRHQQRNVALAGLGESLLAPGTPVHRIVLVLEQVRRGLVGQAVRHGLRLVVPAILPTARLYAAPTGLLGWVGTVGIPHRQEGQDEETPKRRKGRRGDRAVRAGW